MKVSELIEKLKTFPPDREVVIQRDEHGWHPTDEVVTANGKDPEDEDSEDSDHLVSINWNE